MLGFQDIRYIFGQRSTTSNKSTCFILWKNNQKRPNLDSKSKIKIHLIFREYQFRRTLLTFLIVSIFQMLSFLKRCQIFDSWAECLFMKYNIFVCLCYLKYLRPKICLIRYPFLGNLTTHIKIVWIQWYRKKSSK